MKPTTVKEMATMGGHARAKKLSRQRKSAIARQAANVRWRKKRKPKIAKAKTNNKEKGNEQTETI